MPSFSQSTEAAILAALFQGAPLPQTSTLYVALHNANPGEQGTQVTNETSYSNYARVAVPCSPGSWLVAAGDPAQVQNIRPIVFPPCTGTGDVLTFWSVGYQVNGPGQIIASGPIGSGVAYGFSAPTFGALFVPSLPPGIVVGQAVVLYQFGPSMLIPGGFNEGQVYYVVSVGPFTSPSLLLGATPGGNPITSTSPGTGLIVPVSPLTVGLNMVPTFPPSSLITFMD